MNDSQRLSAHEQGLFIAASNASVRTEDLLRQMDGHSPNLRNAGGLTLLATAARHGCVEHVRALMNRCDPLARDNNAMTALMWAVNAESLECVTLLAMPESATLPADDGCTPLMLAAANATTAIINVLVPLSDPLAVSDKRWTALMYAAHTGDPERLDALLPVSHPEARSRQGETAWLLAASTASAERLNALKDHVDTAVTDPQGNTALMRAITSKAPDRTHLQAVRTLLPFSDATVINQAGMSALDLAMANNFTDPVNDLVAVMPRAQVMESRERLFRIKPSAARILDRALIAVVKKERKELTAVMNTVAPNATPARPRSRL